MKSFGVIKVVARAYMAGETVGNVDMAPFESEYGRGHSLIMHSSLTPSCFRVRVNAANRLSLATHRSTYFRKTVLEAMSEQVEPTTVAVARISQPSQMP